MRSAIPVEDKGSRGAVQYAEEIAEFLAYYHIDLVPFDVEPFDLADFVAAHKHRNDQMASTEVN